MHSTVHFLSSWPQLQQPQDPTHYVGQLVRVTGPGAKAKVQYDSVRNDNDKTSRVMMIAFITLNSSVVPLNKAHRNECQVHPGSWNRKK